ncbi:hypothetical protein [Flavobacterium sp.]|uniref:hypothetical protein n=1 Tax=Flavobacterium sp. TaxID=239 RepID=UPI002624A596|nr:hypothetical protein [Flavobacterium sp.]
MKKIFFLPLIVTFLTFLSCERDESLTPTPVLVNGAFVRLDITSKVMNYADPATVFAGNLTAPGGNVSKYNLYVRRTDVTSGNSFGGFKLIGQPITTFPARLVITREDIAAALNMNVSDFNAGDEFRFYGESFDLNGVRFDYSNLSTAIRSNLQYYKQAFRFRTSIVSQVLYTPGEISVYDSYTTQ